jgi:hypothetical protein
VAQVSELFAYYTENRSLLNNQEKNLNITAQKILALNAYCRDGQPLRACVGQQFDAFDPKLFCASPVLQVGVSKTVDN